MTALFAYLDGLPWQPLALYALGYLAFLVAVLSLFKPRHVDECPRCGGQWQRTPRGNWWHACEDRNSLVQP
jgi:hypothetical protein